MINDSGRNSAEPSFKFEKVAATRQKGSPKLVCSPSRGQLNKIRILFYIMQIVDEICAFPLELGHQGHVDIYSYCSSKCSLRSFGQVLLVL